VTTTALPVPEPTETGSRRARLDAAMARLRSGALRGDRLERSLMIAGGILLPLGLLVIVLGWAGASETGRVFEQIPYMISGGMLGLAIVVAGGFSYFGYWLTRIVHETRAQTDRTVEALERIEALLAGASADPVGARPAGNGSPSQGLVATANGTMAHRPDCPIVANRPNLRQVAAGHPGFEPCKICQPG
jgi:hypothetical protein